MDNAVSRFHGSGRAFLRIGQDFSSQSGLPRGSQMCPFSREEGSIGRLREGRCCCPRRAVQDLAGGGAARGIESIGKSVCRMVSMPTLVIPTLELNYCHRGLSQAFYREKLYETYMGYKDLEDFLVNWWEDWSCSKGTTSISLCNETESHCSRASYRPREPARYGTDLAEWRCIQTRALQRQLRTGDGFYQSEDSCHAMRS